jgi:cell division septal protein FtsQ
MRRRLGFAAALSAAILVALSAVGGLGYASSATSHAVNALKNVVVKSNHTNTHLTTVKQSPAQSQYRPGCGLGDKNHIHTGPPGQGGVCPAQGTPHTP